MYALSYGYVFAADQGGGTRESVQELAIGQEQIILALIAIIATAIAGLVYTIKNNSLVKEGSKAAQQVNQAVNNVGPGEHRLYDMVAMIRDEIKYLTEAQHDFANKGWATLPADIGTASRLTETIRDLQSKDKFVVQKLEEITVSLKSLHEGLQEHVEWEMQQKYKEAGNHE